MRAGDQPVAHVGIEIVRRVAQAVQMQRGAFGSGDDIGSGARPCGFGQFDLPHAPSAAGDAVQRGQRLRRRRPRGNSRRRRRCADPDDASRAVTDQLVRHRDRCRPDRADPALHGVVGQRQIGGAARQRTKMVEARDERKAAGARQSAEGRLQAEHAAERRRHTDRTVGVGAERDRHQPPATAPPDPPDEPPVMRADVVRIARWAVVAVLAGEVVGVLTHVQRADQHRAGGLQAADQGCIRARPADARG